MTLQEFIAANRLSPEEIGVSGCLAALMGQMEQGLRGQGNIPMIPSYLPATIALPENQACCVLDAGGTNLRAAEARFDGQGSCRIGNLLQIPMPGTEQMLDSDAFYARIAALARSCGSVERVGFCFSYNVQQQRDLDGVLLAWCKEVRVPDAVGKPVGQSLRAQLGADCNAVHVLNDSVAALLGASLREQVHVGLILGTGINVCYAEDCARIPKVPSDLRGEKMIISTEVGEFDGFVKGPLDLELFSRTEDPRLAHGEKQCAGGYLGQLICLAWRAAAREKLLEDWFLEADVPLAQISAMLAGRETGIPGSDGARLIAGSIICRAARIAAVLCAGPILRCTRRGETVNVAVEGSQFHKLSGFRDCFDRELTQALRPYGITHRFVFEENACLKGAALAAFAPGM